jgi:hypothetical protein
VGKSERSLSRLGGDQHDSKIPEDAWANSGSPPKCFLYKARIGCREAVLGHDAFAHPPCGSVDRAEPGNVAEETIPNSSGLIGRLRARGRG